jgi:predicted negative regulator of RcsB-dependent stress response
MPQPQPTGEDRFVQTTLELAAWAQRNARTLVLGVAALMIVGFSVKYYFDYKHSIEETASSELRAIRLQTQSGSPAQVVDQLRGFIVQFEGSSYAHEGRVLLAHALLLENRAAEAIEPARQAITDIGNDVLALRAAFLLAAAYEEVADTAAAISVYQDIGARVDARVERSRALQAAARLIAASGDPVGAAAIYDQLAEITPEDAPVRNFYVQMAAELRAQSLVPATAETPAQSSEEG